MLVAAGKNPDRPAFCEMPLHDEIQDTLQRIAESINIPTTHRPLREWLGDLVEVASNTLALACRDHSGFRATRTSLIAERIFGHEGAQEALRGLCMLRGIGDHDEIRSSMSGRAELVPAFRVHTFLRSMEGLFGAFRSIEGRPGLCELDVERKWDVETGQHGLRRVFEMLYCECCGEVFLGGKRGTRTQTGKPTPTELVPVDPDLDGIPETSSSLRFEDLSYNEYALFWPRLGNESAEPAVSDRLNEGDLGTWVNVLLDTTTGSIRDSETSGPRRGRVTLNENEFSGLLYVKARGRDATAEILIIPERLFLTHALPAVRITCLVSEMHN